MKGLVIKNTGFWYTVLCDDGKTIDCKVKGNFRLKGIRTTNPVAVGDRVVISTPDENKGSAGGDGTAFITSIEDRRNYIIRKSQNLSKQSHILAANVDQAVLVITIAHPETSTTFIDRFLASAEAYRVPVILVFNKTDLLTPEELRYQQMMVQMYEGVGYQCIQMSALNKDEGVNALSALLSDKVTLFSGNSGVGKSTLLNALIPGVNLRTSEISDAHDTGMHTTTFSEMLPYNPTPNIQHPTPNTQHPTPNTQHPTPNTQHPAPSTQHPAPSAWLIDTPGIKGFGTFDMEPEEICGYFKEIFRYSSECRFNNCTHTHEPGCAVIKAVEDHYIALSRYNSYISMLNDKEEGKYRAAY